MQCALVRGPSSPYDMICYKRLDEAFCAVVKTHKRRSNKIYKTEITNIKIENQVICKYRVDPQRIGLTLIAELSGSNLGLNDVSKK